MAKTEIFKDNPELLEELRVHFTPKPEIVKTLPNPKEVENFKEVYVLQSDSTYKIYKMLNGAWYEVS